MAKQEIHLSISGMSCAHCKAAVEKALQGLPGVARTEVFLEEGRAVVEIDPARVKVEELKQKVEEAGYTVA